MIHLIDKTIERARLWLAQWPRPAILWSGGKDSTALLHLLKFRVNADLPVVQYREPKFRERYEYSDNLIKLWNLEVHEYPPSRVAIADGPDVTTGEMRFDLLKYHQWGHKSVVLSLGTERPVGDEKYLCGVDFLSRPTGTFNWPWNAVFVGTKRCDTDPIKGEIPLAMDIRHAEGSPVSLYLLHDWTDADVFDYLDASDINPDPNRYEVDDDGEWQHKADKSKNADFIPTCLNCIDRHSKGPAYCPKLKAEVSNMSHLAPYEDIVFPELGFRPVWNKEAAK
jgi:3'-phosphoadenosine 5'-phosphosulfate sulfotransferase (PAPS reductase)/FAD synthetase